MDMVGKYKGRALYEATGEDAVAFKAGDKVFIMLWDDDQPVIEEVEATDIAGPGADTSAGLYKAR